VRKGIEAEFDAIAAEAPGFAGFYRSENGQMVVRVVPTQDAAPVVRAVTAHSGRRIGGRGVAVVADAQFTIRELMGWRDLVREGLDPALWVSLDADERADRVVIGVRKEFSAARVMASVVALGVPQTAVRIDVAEQVQEQASLTDKIRPLVGGLRIRVGSVYCTLGLNVNFGATRYILSNSHCTTVPGVVNGDSLYQPDKTILPLTFNDVAKESSDPAYFSGGVCPAGRVCRYSDAALFTLRTSGGGVPTASYAIVRTSVVGTTSAGNLTIGAKVPITGGVTNPTIGDTLRKTGQTSGTTYGLVTATCTDYPTSGNRTFICQDRVDAYSGAGDSGSPVWHDDGTGATVYGILWGGTGTFFVFSNLDNLLTEMGGFTFC
jgi:hypothetical protein